MLGVTIRLQPVWLAGLGVVLRLGNLAWSSNAPAQTAGQGAVSDQEALRLQGEKLFETRCFVCHGREGKGDGPAATGLGANPRNFTDPQWQQATPDAKIRKVIKQGGQSAGESGAMPPNADLSDAQVDALTVFLRSLKGL
ncbi:MAG: cytochrome c [Verrucomicrobia bacterium]|nr:cytochrome c [Verrucomicrobiota bacterium]